MDVSHNLTQNLKDSAYVAVGFGVLGFQRAQVARRELTTAVATDRERLEASVRAQVEDLSSVLDAQLGEVRAQLGKAAANLEGVLEPVARELEDRLDEVEERLPEQVRAVVASARQVAGSAATQVRSLLAA